MNQKKNKLADIHIKEYNNSLKTIWDLFLEKSNKNFFFFKRDYIEYDKTIQDCSLLFYEKETLLAILPGNIKKKIFYSHQKLTYGGLIAKKLDFENYENIFHLLLKFLKKKGIKKIIYKLLPNELNSSSSGCEEYLLFKNKFNINEVYLNSYINIKQNNFSENIKRNLKKVKNIHIKKMHNIKDYYRILYNLLKKKYNAKPTHTLIELKKLIKIFQDNIEILCCYSGRKNLGGYIIFKYNNELNHMQYSAWTDLGYKKFAQDYLTDHIIKTKEEKLFSFGKSDDSSINYINKNLLQKKLKYGSKTICEKVYERNL